MDEYRGFNELSHELLCNIFKYLPLKQVLLIGTLNKNFCFAVELHLRLIKVIDFCEDKIIGYMAASITDKHLLALLKKCPNVEIIHGFHPVRVNRSRLRKPNGLSIPGIIDALSLCPNLKKIEISNIRLLEAFAQHLPLIQIEGFFRNRDGAFPVEHMQQVKLSPFMKLTSLHLIGVQVPELVGMHELEHLFLEWISFTRLHPFRSFSALKLKTFVMKQCLGPAFPLRYYPLFIALGFAQDLTRLEIVCVPILGGMVARSVEEASRNNGFRKISKLVVADCKGIMESDLGQLMIAASQTLDTLCVQSSLTKDSLFASLRFVGCDFSQIKSLHLGYVEAYPPKGEWPIEALLTFGLADVQVVPSSLTDGGINAVSLLFPNVQTLTISNCQHIVNPRTWHPENSMWSNLTCLIMERCHCVPLLPFTSFIASLDNLEVLIVKNMFREPPKGCSHVGLSAGTGLGLSSAIVSTCDEHIAVVGRGSDEEDLENPHGIEVRLQSYRDERSNIVVQDMPDLNANVQHNENIAAVPECSQTSSSSRQSRKSNSQKRVSTSCRKRSSHRTKYRKASDSSKRRRNSKHNKQSGSGIKAKASCSNKKSFTCGANNSYQVSSNSDYSGPLTRNRARMKSTHSLNKSISDLDSDQSDSKCYNGSEEHKATNGMKVEPDHKGKGSHHSNRGNSKRSTCNSSSNTSSSSSDEEEADVTMPFHLVSKCLVSLTIISCGISEIDVDECTSIAHIEAQNCRNLKKVNSSKCEELTKINLIHCPKLDVMQLVSGILTNKSVKPLLVYVRPVIKEQCYGPNALVDAVMCRATNMHQSLYTVHHYHKSDSDSAQFRENFLSWMQVMQSNQKDGCSYFKSIKKVQRSWGHMLHKISGLSVSGSYEILTNNPNFVTYWRLGKFGKSEFLQDSKGEYEVVLPETLFISPEIEEHFALGEQQICFFVDVKS